MWSPCCASALCLWSWSYTFFDTRLSCSTALRWVPSGGAESWRGAHAAWVLRALVRVTHGVDIRPYCSSTQRLAPPGGAGSRCCVNAPRPWFWSYAVPVLGCAVARRCAWCHQAGRKLGAEHMLRGCSVSLLLALHGVDTRSRRSAAPRLMPPGGAALGPILDRDVARRRALSTYSVHRLYVCASSRPMYTQCARYTARSARL